MGLSNDAIGDAAHKGSPQPTEPPTPHDYETGAHLLAQAIVRLVLALPCYEMGPRTFPLASSILLTCSSITS